MKKKAKKSSMDGLNPQKARREIGQQNPKPNIAMKPMKKPMPRGR